MNEEQKRLARGALNNAQNAIANDRPWEAEQWATSASIVIREARWSDRDTARLVAPRDGATTGDKVAIVLSAMVLAYVVFSALAGSWTL